MCEKCDPETIQMDEDGTLSYDIYNGAHEFVTKTGMDRAEYWKHLEYQLRLRLVAMQSCPSLSDQWFDGQGFFILRRDGLETVRSVPEDPSGLDDRFGNYL